MSKGEFKDSLFAFFEMKKECYFKEIIEYFDQPTSFTKKVVNEICDKRKVGRKFVYKLKKIYR